MDSWIETLPIRPVTRQLVNRLILDLPLPPPVLVDFGVDSEQHYRALQAILLANDALPDAYEDDAVSDAKTMRQQIVELDAALGNGALLDALVKKYAPQYVNLVPFPNQLGCYLWQDRQAGVVSGLHGGRG